MGLTTLIVTFDLHASGALPGADVETYLAQLRSCHDAVVAARQRLLETGK